ncbi:MAG: hypothetical protein AAF638_04600 [Pseudomonadota bacterium]
MSQSRVSYVTTHPLTAFKGTPRVSWHIENGEIIVEVSDQAPAAISKSAGAWLNDGVELEEGTALRFQFRGDEFLGVVKSGKLVFEDGDVKNRTTTGAVMAAIRHRMSDAPNLNGWNYLEYRSSDSADWMSLAELRRSAQATAEDGGETDA